MVRYPRNRVNSTTIEVINAQLEQIFGQRIDISAIPSAELPASRAKAIVSIDVATTAFWFGNCSPQRPDVLKVAYETKLLSPEGVTLSSWRTNGIGSDFCGGKLSPNWSRAKTAMRLGLQDAAAKLLYEIAVEIEASSELGTTSREH